MKYRNQNCILYFYFSDDFDYMTIQTMKDRIIEILNKETYQKAVFDFRDVNFVDSTGIGFVLARYKQLKDMKKELYLSNLSKENRIIFEMSGVFQIIKQIQNEVNYE